MVDQKIVDEAKARGIVPGAVIKTATGNDYTQVVRRFKEWERSGGGVVWNGSLQGDSICIYDAQNGEWATVITPAPQAAAEGLVDGDACECGPAMRAAIIELAKELGVGLRSGAPASAPLLWYGGRLCYTSGGPRCETIRTMLQSGQFYDRLSRHKKTIRIDGHEVKFKDNGDINVGCTSVDFSTLEAVYNKAKQTKQ